MTAHPDDESILRLADDDLAPAEAAELGRHVADCVECRGRLEDVREALAGYQRFHETVLKPSLPATPGPWAPVRRRAVARFPVKTVLAAAAAVALAIVLMRRFEQPPAVKAAELLRKAVAAEQAAPPATKRIRIRTRRHTWVRAAHVVPAGTISGEAAEVKALFDTAGYDWEDPLSASAYDRWSERQARKEARVETVAEGGAEQTYVIRTNASEGAVSEATLTLRAQDLHAIAGTLKLRSDDAIEMTELPDEPSTAAVAPQPEPAPTPAPIAGAPPPAGPAEELRVLVALHRIGADLGEPVEVRREGGAVLVSCVGLTAARQAEVRAAVSNIAGVQVQFETVHGRSSYPAASPQPRAPRPNGPSPLVTELQARLNVPAAELSDQLIDMTDRAMEQAYAVRALARRFPADVERTLQPEDGAALAGMVRDHAEALAQSAAAMRRLLAALLPQVESRGDQSSSWQGAAEALLVSVQELDQMLNGAAAVDRGRLAQVLGRLDGQIAALARTAR